jgi:nucleoside phosphorylase
MGAEATARALGWLLGECGPARVVSAGFCGGLTADFPLGAVVQPEEVVSEAGERWPADPGPRVGAPARLVTVAAPLLGAGARLDLHRQTGAHVVDMESAAAARLCRQAGVPFHALRVVSDDLEHPLPADLLPALRDGRVDGLRLARAALRRPGLIVDLWRLARQTCRCSLVLAEALEGFLPRPGASGT